MKKIVKKSNQKEYNISFIRQIFIVFCIVSIFTVMIGSVFVSYGKMNYSVTSTLQGVSTQISQKIKESLNLLTSLASLPEYYDASIPWEEKVKKIDKINEYYGYMFICYVDEKIQVYTLGEEPASLASREHMQKLYSTRESIVTDSFVAGADGVTLNYTVAVPLIDENKMTGSLFCSIYFDEIVELMRSVTTTNGTEAVLIGSKGQVMSSTNDLVYGVSCIEIFDNMNLFGVTINQLETKLLARDTGAFHSIQSTNLFYTKYAPIENTNWDVLITADFWTIYLDMLPYTCLIILVLLVSTFILYYLVIKYIVQQEKRTQNLLNTLNELEKKVYHSDDLGYADYENILQMSSKGLKDELTGVATRTFFLYQVGHILKESNETPYLTLCFVDLDDLKILNDSNGHYFGDIALKKVGTILREYEKKYDGLVGRYGGDEFILVLRDIDDLEELQQVLAELADQLHFLINIDGKEIKVHCSIGACVHNNEETLEMMIANADKALYDVKRHDKGNYSIFLVGD